MGRTKNFALHKSSESVCIQEVWWKPEAEHTGVCENRKSAKLPECERLSPIYSGYVPDPNISVSAAMG
ncbi:hypothetical protein HB825_07725 [Listeria booriae]|nr:hypothetical protein [Listeria booriae]MBC6134723.1 hypothetical protein [Listeria booriae]